MSYDTLEEYLMEFDGPNTNFSYTYAVGDYLLKSDPYIDLLDFIQRSFVVTSFQKPVTTKKFTIFDFELSNAFQFVLDSLFHKKTCDF